MSTTMTVTEDEKRIIEERRKKMQEAIEKQKPTSWMEKAADYFMTHYSGKTFIKKENPWAFHVFQLLLDKKKIISAFKKGFTSIALPGKDPEQMSLQFSYSSSETDFDVEEIIDQDSFYLNDFYNPYIPDEFYSHVIKANGHDVTLEEYKESLATKENPILGRKMLSQEEIDYFLDLKNKFDKVISAYEKGVAALANSLDGKLNEIWF